MGSAKYAEKYRAKYGRDPTAEELAAFTQKYKAKKEARKSNEATLAAPAAAPVDAPAAKAAKKAPTPKKSAPKATIDGGAESSADSEAGEQMPVSTAASSSKKAGVKRKRAAEAAPPVSTPLGRSANLIFSKGLTSVLRAVGKAPKTQSISEAAFATMWTEVNAQSAQVLKDFEGALKARAPQLSAEQRKALLAPYRERLALSLTPADDVIERCRSKQAAKDAAKAAKRPPKTPKPPKEQVVDPAIRDAGLAVLAKHKYVFCLPCPPCLCAACPFALDALTDRCAFPVDSPRAGTMC